MWSWITEREKLERWLPGCAIDPRVGGPVSFDFGEEGTATGVVGEVVPPGPEGLLVHSWRWPGVPDSAVRWALEGVPGGTRLVLVHGELLPEPAAEFATGWHVMLDALTLAAGGGSSEDAWSAVGEVAELYAPSANAEGAPSDG
ncbi:SRPBCC domain-containing protein [Nocardiopsis terrae]